MVKADPRFYVRLAAWYADHGDVRDHKEMFVVTLVAERLPGPPRRRAWRCCATLPPYQVVRVLDFIHGRKTTRKVVARCEDGREACEAASGCAQVTAAQTPRRCGR